MLRMLRAEWYKMCKSRCFKVLCVVAILLGLVNVLMNMIINEDFIKQALGNEISQQQIESILSGSSNEIVIPGNLGFHSNGAKDPFNVTGFEAFHFSFGSGVIEIFIAVLVGTMLAKEYSEGTIKNTLAYGKKRTDFYIAKFANIVAGTSVIMLVMTGVSTIGTTIINGWGDKFQISQLINILSTFIGAVIIFSAVVAILMLIATLIKSNGATIGVAIALFILLPTTIGFLYGIYNWFDKIYELSLFYNSALVTAVKASYRDILKASFIGLITMIIALGAGISVFKNQDIK